MAPARRAATRFRVWALAPLVIVLLLLTVLPIVTIAIASLQEIRWVDARRVSTWVGADNYAALARDTLLHAGLVNTAIVVIVASLAQIALGLLLAWLCREAGGGSRPFRAIMMLPILIPGIIIGAIWKLMYNYQFGILNQVLESIGLPRVDWLGSPDTALFSVILVDIWHWTPFAFLLLLAAIESLPEDIFEAARIDGASRSQIFRRITLPLLMPAIFVTLAFRAVATLKIFDEVYLLTGGGPGTSTEVLSFTIYQRFFVQDNVGYGSAISMAVIFTTALLLAVSLSLRQRSS